MEQIIEIITGLIEQRKRERRVPHCAMLMDIVSLSGMSREEVLSEIETLKDEGKIAIKETINSYSIYLR